MSRPRLLLISVAVTLFLLTGALPLVHADATDYAIDWVAAAPASYDHRTGGGAYDDRTLRSDVANALVASDFTCGDIVSYFAQITVDNPATAETLEFEVAFSANTLLTPGAGFVDIVNVAVNYGPITDLIAGEDAIDNGIDDDGGSTATLISQRFEPASGLIGGSLYENPLTQANLIGVIQVDDLEASDTTIVVRVDAQIDCLKGSTPAGLLQAELRSSTLLGAIPLPLPIGIQSVIFSGLDLILFPPDVADLAIAQQGPAGVAPGEPLTYTIVMTNAGPDLAVAPRVTDTLPLSVTLLGWQAPVDWQCTTVGDPVQSLGCQHDQLAAGATVTLTIAATTSPTLALRTRLTNTVTFTSATLDPALPNRAVVTTTVQAPALYVAKAGALALDRDGSHFLSPGDTVAYTVTVLNQGNAPATGVVFSDTLASASHLLSGTLQTTAGVIVRDPDVDGTTVMVDLGVVDAASAVTITFQAAVTTAVTTVVTATDTTFLLANQGVVTYEQGAPLLSDDPMTALPGDATLLTVTLLSRYYPCVDLPDAECAALQALYVQTNGAFWRNHQGWFATPAPCSWYGVRCATDEQGILHVVELNLPGNGLQGTLPKQLGALTALRTLDLAHNALAAIIPPEIGALTALETLNLADNLLVGELPITLGDLTALRTLYLYGNNFSGDLPVTLRNLTQLERFFFQGTQLCAPTDPALQSWLAERSTVAVPDASACRHIDLAAKPLVLVYAGLDNNLSMEWGKLVNNLEVGADPEAFSVRLLIDGYGEGNSYEYLLQHDDDPTCPSLVTGFLECNRYRRGVTLRAQSEDTAQRDLLALFVINALYEQPNATAVILVLVGHGAGWGANGLPAQPRGWTEQGGPVTDIAGGMLWDDTAGDGALASRSLSTRALGEALAQVQANTGKGIDLLYLDACSMAMAEVAYEVRGSVDYLLATENTKWATFPYDRLLPEVTSAPDIQTLGERWLAIEAALLDALPNADYTFSLLDLAGMEAVASATDALVAALQPQLPAQLPQLDAALTASAFFESNYDGLIDTSDTYIDLFVLAGQLATHFSESAAVTAAAADLQAAVTATVLQELHRRAADSTAPPLWQDIGGLSIYWPLATDEEKRLALYNATNLQWAADSQWDEWLTNYWQSVEDRNLAALEACAQTAACPGLTGWGFVDAPQTVIFVPIVQH